MGTQPHNTRNWTGCLILAATASAIVARPVAGGEPASATFYMVIYAAEEVGRPETSHCFATFAWIAPASEAGARPVVELHHINWFSRQGHETGVTRCLFEDGGRPVPPEPGENRTTREALLLAQRCGLRISRWGPYEIDRELFERALRQIDLLEGRVPGRRMLYKACDLGFREWSAIVALNCIHAISDIDRDAGPLRTWTNYGERAARRVVRHLGRWIKAPGRELPEVWASIWEETWGPGPAPDLPIALGNSPWPARVPPWPSEIQARSDAENAAGPPADHRRGPVREVTDAAITQTAGAPDE